MCTCVPRKNLDLTQINYEALINFDIGAERCPNYASADVKQLPLTVSQAPRNQIIKKTVAVDFHPPNNLVIQILNFVFRKRYDSFSSCLQASRMCNLAIQLLNGSEKSSYELNVVKMAYRNDVCEKVYLNCMSWSH